MTARQERYARAIARIDKQRIHELIERYRLEEKRVTLDRIKHALGIRPTDTVFDAIIREKVNG